MSDRPTPETDAAVDDTAFEDKKQLHTDWVTAFFARKLERERDELLAYLDAAHYATCNAELRKERDELQLAYDVLATEHCLSVNKLAQERDEAREAGWKAAMQAVWERLPMQEYANDPMTPREVAKLIEFVRSQKEGAK